MKPSQEGEPPGLHKRRKTACGRLGDDLVETGPVLNSLIPSGGSKKNRTGLPVHDRGGITGYPRWKGVSENAAMLRLKQGGDFSPLKQKM